MPDKTNIDVPPNWVVKRYERTGHGNLIASFRCSHTDWELHVVPYKSYQLSGFTNCHRITLTKDDSIEVVAEGLDIEYTDEAEEVAKEVMRSI